MVKPLMEPAINGTLLFILAPRIAIFSRNEDTFPVFFLLCSTLCHRKGFFFNIIIIKKNLQMLQNIYF